MTRSALIGITLALALTALGLHGRAPAEENRTIAVNKGTYLRTYVVWRAAATRKGDKIVHGGGPGTVASPLPPVDWRTVAFDDSTWKRERMPGLTTNSDGKRMMSVEYGHSSHPTQALFCARARFNVPDPSAVKNLKLSLKFRGGVVVYVNGKEVGRAHLPKGKLELMTLAEDYPPKCFEYAKGKTIRGHHASPKTYKDALALRLRGIDELAISASVLRKGVNVLAIESHRAPYYGVSLFKGGRREASNYWAQSGIVDLTLSAAAGIESNAKRLDGVQLWPGSTLTRNRASDYANRIDVPGLIRIVGARNGVFNGRAVISSKGDIGAVKATVSELKQTNGKGIIAANNITILYGSKELRSAPPSEVKAEKTRKGKKIGAFLPVWLKVRVSKDAPAGVYKGALTVEAGKTLSLPVELKVANWTLPETKEFGTLTGIIQSPASVAMQYKVPMWSEKHWKLMEESFKHIAALGGNKVVIPCVSKSNFGNIETMARWIGEGEKWSVDLKHVERYIDLARKHLNIRLTVLYCWDSYMGGHARFDYITKSSREKNRRPILVSKLDPSSGATEVVEGPWMDGPKFDMEKAKAFWKPLAEGLTAILKERGLEKTLVLGMVGDGKPASSTCKLFRRLLPSATWTENGHMDRRGMSFFGTKIGYNTSVYTHMMSPPPHTQRKGRKGYRPFGWKQMTTLFPRGSNTLQGRLSSWSPLSMYHFVSEVALVSDLAGIGRTGADFWPLLRTRGKAFSKGYWRNQWSPTLNGRFQMSNWAQLNMDHGTPNLLAPGPNGAIPTDYFEALREGIQECEARIFIEKAIDGKKINGELAKKAWAVLDERALMMRSSLVSKKWRWMNTQAPTVMAEKLFAMAAEVEKALAGK